MAKTLYISDLDGTLLDQNGEVSDYTASVINHIVEQGGLFTLASARSEPACRDILARLKLNLPVVMTNGAMLYHPVEKRFVQVQSIPQPVIPKISDLLDRNRVCGFFYCLSGTQISAYFRQFFSDTDRVYYKERLERYEGRIFQADDILTPLQDHLPVYVVGYGDPEQLYQVEQELGAIPEVSVALYPSTYDEDKSFMDIFCSSASKSAGMRAVQQWTGATELVAFGDNFNDMDMLQAADRCYVPENGVDAAKELATELIESCGNHGVARFMAREFSLE